MSISGSLSNALSGLSISGRHAQVVSQNIANAQTEGYSRRSLATSSGWGGVKADGIVRSIDRGLVSDRRLAESQLSADQRTADMLARIEGIIGVPGEGDSLVSRITTLDTALIAASSDPASTQRLVAVNDALGGLTRFLNNATDNIQSLRQDADQAIARDVDMLNTSLQRVEQLNANISRTRAAGQDVSDLQDMRKQVIDDISGIVPLRQFIRENDQIALMSTSGQVLIDGRAAKFTFDATPTITAEMSLASGGLSGISINGDPLDANDGFGRLTGGSLAASFMLRDDELTQAQNGIDQVAFDFITRFSDPDIDPTVGAAGILTDAGNPADPLTFNGVAGRIKVNARVDPSQGGDVILLRDGIGATTSGPVGRSEQLDRWRDAITIFGGSSMIDNAAQVSSQISGQRVQADGALSFSSSRWDGLHNAELANGVDSDAELQRLLLVEQAYAANARVIQAANSMMQRLMEI